MKDFYIFASSLEYIENNLSGGIMLYGEDSEGEAIYDRFENSLDRAKP